MYMLLLIWLPFEGEAAESKDDPVVSVVAFRTSLDDESRCSPFNFNRRSLNQGGSARETLPSSHQASTGFRDGEDAWDWRGEVVAFSPTIGGSFVPILQD